MITTFCVSEFLLDCITLKLIGWLVYLDDLEWRITFRRIRCCAFEDDNPGKNSPGIEKPSVMLIILLYKYQSYCAVRNTMRSVVLLSRPGLGDVAARSPPVRYITDRSKCLSLIQSRVV